MHPQWFSPNHLNHFGAQTAFQPHPFASLPRICANRKAAHLIPDELVRSVMAVGTSDQCREKVAEYIEAGVTCPILYPMMDDVKSVIDAFAGWEP